MENPTPLADSDINPMDMLLEEYAESHRFQRGEIIEGVISSVTPKAILVDIGGKSDALVHPREVEHIPRQTLKSLRPGEPIAVYVLDTDNDGTVIVSLTRAAQQDDWNKAQALMESEETIELTVIDTNKGGVIVRLGSLRGFVPGSQLMPSWHRYQNPARPDDRWRDLVGETLKLRVIEVTPDQNRLILSERQAQQRRANKRRILEGLKVGTVEKGIVSNIVPFGAFVNVKGVDGLLHISEFSWQRVDDPREFLQVGQTIDVYILDVDLNRERLALSLKRLEPDPWSTVEEICKPGDFVEVTIVNITSFGAFAALATRPELEGLIHISELADYEVADPAEIVRVGERYRVKVLSVRPRQRRLGFSLKEALKGEDEGHSTQDNDTIVKSDA